MHNESEVWVCGDGLMKSGDSNGAGWVCGDGLMKSGDSNGAGWVCGDGLMKSGGMVGWSGCVVMG